MVGHGVGRRDPCPCGSGLEFGHCCGRVVAEETEDPPALVLLSAMEKLVEYWGQSRWDDERARAMALFLGEDVAQGEEILFRRHEAPLLQAYSLFEHRLESGGTIVSRFLGERASDLTSAERSLLEAYRASRAGPFRVLEIREEVMRVHDLLRGETLTVVEPPDSLEVGELVFTRLLPGPNGGYEILLEPIHFTEEQEDLVEEVARAAFEGRPVDLFEAIGPQRVPLTPAIARLSRGFDLAARMFEVDVDAEGAEALTDLTGTDPAYRTRPGTTDVLWDVRDAEAVARRLDEAPNLLVHDETALAWTEVVDGEPEVLGWLFFDPERKFLQLRTHAREHAERGRAIFEELLGDTIAEGEVFEHRG